MADGKETNLSQFIGTDKRWEFEVLGTPSGVVQDAATWPVSWMLKKSLGHLDAAAKITKTTGGGGITITGTYDPDPAVNTQRVVVTLEDTDTDPLSAGTYFWELKRTALNGEAVLGYGEYELIRGVHRA